MPKSVAQLAGILVTAIVTLGTDLDVIYSVPLGVFAGAFVVFAVTVSDPRPRAAKIRMRRAGLR